MRISSCLLILTLINIIKTQWIFKLSCNINSI